MEGTEDRWRRGEGGNRLNRVEGYISSFLFALNAFGRIVQFSGWLSIEAQADPRGMLGLLSRAKHVPSS